MQGSLATPPPPTELGYFTMGQRAELRGALEGVTGGPGDSRNTESLTSSPKHPVSQPDSDDLAANPGDAGSIPGEGSKSPRAMLHSQKFKKKKKHRRGSINLKRKKKDTVASNLEMKL